MNEAAGDTRLPLSYTDDGGVTRTLLACKLPKNSQILPVTTEDGQTNPILISTPPKPLQTNPATPDDPPASNGNESPDVQTTSTTKNAPPANGRKASSSIDSPPENDSKASSSRNSPTSNGSKASPSSGSPPANVTKDSSPKNTSATPVPSTPQPMNLQPVPVNIKNLQPVMQKIVQVAPARNQVAAAPQKLAPAPSKNFQGNNAPKNLNPGQNTKQNGGQPVRHHPPVYNNHNPSLLPVQTRPMNELRLRPPPPLPGTQQKQIRCVTVYQQGSNPNFDNVNRKQVASESPPALDKIETQPGNHIVETLPSLDHISMIDQITLGKILFEENDEFNKDRSQRNSGSKVTIYERARIEEFGPTTLGDRLFRDVTEQQARDLQARREMEQRRTSNAEIQKEKAATLSSPPKNTNGSRRAAEDTPDDPRSLMVKSKVQELLLKASSEIRKDEQKAPSNKRASRSTGEQKESEAKKRRTGRRARYYEVEEIEQEPAEEMEDDHQRDEEHDAEGSSTSRPRPKRLSELDKLRRMDFGPKEGGTLEELEKNGVLSLTPRRATQKQGPSPTPSVRKSRRNRGGSETSSHDRDESYDSREAHPERKRRKNVSEVRSTMASPVELAESIRDELKTPDNNQKNDESHSNVSTSSPDVVKSPAEVAKTRSTRKVTTVPSMNSSISPRTHDDSPKVKKTSPKQPVEGISKQGEKIEEIPNPIAKPSEVRIEQKIAEKPTAVAEKMKVENEEMVAVPVEQPVILPLEFPAEDMSVAKLKEENSTPPRQQQVLRQNDIEKEVRPHDDSKVMEATSSNFNVVFDGSDDPGEASIYEERFRNAINAVSEGVKIKSRPNNSFSIAFPVIDDGLFYLPENSDLLYTNWTKENVRDWVKYIADENTSASFEREMCDGKALMCLTDDEMKNELNVPLGFRVKIKKGIKHLQLLKKILNIKI